MKDTTKLSIAILFLVLTMLILSIRVFAGGPPPLRMNAPQQDAPDKTLIVPPELTPYGFTVEGGETYKVVRVGEYIFQLMLVECCPCPEEVLPEGVTAIPSDAHLPSGSEILIPVAP